MGKLFGTDGIRGKANVYPMTAEIALKTGRAVAQTFKDKGQKIIIGKDTRLSGDVFEHALIAGICSMGLDVYLAGVIPTPGVAYLAVSTENVAAGIVISASHNPYFDNGIKLFNSDGYKLDDDTEAKIEAVVLSDDHEEMTSDISETGQVFFLNDAGQRYLDFLRSTTDCGFDFSGLKAVVDCSNGASSSIAPDFFRSAGIDVSDMFTSPDGLNINDNCGSEHTEDMVRKVLVTHADIGLAFDGDADRLIAVDEKGNSVSGDQIIAICANHAKRKGRLQNNCVVTTVMSNMGLVKAFESIGINHVMSGVGDRNVMLEMKKHNSVIGGEDSGHMIFLDKHTTGDGMLSALMLLEVMYETKQPLSELAGIMSIFPQKLVNVDVTSKPDITTVPEIMAVINEVENELNGTGRVLVRYSGTQSMCRVMVEAETTEDTNTFCRMIADTVEKILG